MKLYEEGSKINSSTSQKQDFMTPTRSKRQVSKCLKGGVLWNLDHLQKSYSGTNTNTVQERGVDQKTKDSECLPFFEDEVKNF